MLPQGCRDGLRLPLQPAGELLQFHAPQRLHLLAEQTDLRAGPVGNAAGTFEAAVDLRAAR
ncbi:MAG: hypothetical protein E6K70_26110 [Planctomycetota bacterium]|nr:MAG: hypothetical protein E6K70_26110 [Planctomycetota bacterium]